MAVFTPLDHADADRISRAHGAGACLSIEPVARGSVNSNFFLHTETGRYFLRIYEEQEREGVGYEWALLEHLTHGGIPVPHRMGRLAPGEMRVAGKPVALFEAVTGDHSCQAQVSPAKADAVGTALAEVHQVGQSFPLRQESRFGLSHIVQRLDNIDLREHADLVDVVQELRQATQEVEAQWPSDAPRGLIHGDLFRDNVYWQDGRLVALLDWESASQGLLGYDLMVTILAWCYGDTFGWDLASALTRAYTRVRPMEAAELEGLRTLGMAAAVRFTVTRITDFHLREGIGERVQKDYRRFLERLRTLRNITPGALAERLLGA